MVAVTCMLTNELEKGWESPASARQSHLKIQINFGGAAAMRPRLCADAAMKKQINNNPKNLLALAA